VLSKARLKVQEGRPAYTKSGVKYPNRDALQFKIKPKEASHE
jgi:hypothetical protein